MNNNNSSQFIQKRKIQRYIPIKVFSRTHIEKYYCPLFIINLYRNVRFEVT